MVKHAVEDMVTKRLMLREDAQRAIDRLQRLGIVNQIEKSKRDRVFCAKALLEILEEPAQLTRGKSV